ncbi:MAG: tetratricopeptide repeat protein [Candidatus Delongbacteria bacterium]|nr:tetratricopeptide repeat protein [Candidatus Delongbacteria bacterium]MCG2759621.1 tetratricopeptide repeat protein [Candidatus Delongbacteria bacterium]
MGKKDVTKSFAKAVESYESVLAIKPDYHQAKLYLVELFTMIPRDMGGDSIRAEKYVLELESADIVLGAKARDLILPDDADRVEFWQKILKNNQNKTGINEALGKAYLYEDNVEEAKKCFENEIRLDPNKNILYVDIGRYYLMQAMQNRNKIDSLSTYVIDAFEVYLNSKPEPINSMKAFALGNQAMIKFQSSDKEGGKVLQQKAESYDPNYSKAFGTPSKLLFDQPDKVSDAHSYFSRPF